MRRPFTVKDVRVDKNFRQVEGGVIEAKGIAESHAGLWTDPHGSSLFQTDIITKSPALDVRAYGEGVGGGGDDTVAFQATFMEAKAGTYPRKVLIPNGNFHITDTLEVTSGMVIDGSNKSIWSGQYGADDKPSCLITFAPTSEKDLFHVHRTGGSGLPYASNTNISNLAIKGNTTGGITHSRHALHLDSVAQSIFKNIGIRHFQRGHYAINAMSNRFKNVYIGYCSEDCFYYDVYPPSTGTASTSDVWDACIFRETPLGGIIKKGYAITFDSCLFETLGGGVRIYRECGVVTFINPYVENVPTVSDGFVWNMGNDGTTNWGGNNLIIIGGFQLGRDDMYGGKTGVCVEINHCSGVQIISPHINKYVIGIASDNVANTPDNSVYVAAPAFYDVTYLYYQMAGKMWGSYPTGTLDSGAINPKTYGHSIQMVGLVTYANNAAAIAGGLAVGDFYRTNADPDTVCVVH